MVAPIIIKDQDGCLGLFDSVHETVANLDRDDVLAREYVAYDSRGLLLRIEPAAGASAAEIRPAEEVPSHAADLSAALQHALRQVSADVEDESLPGLVAMAKRIRRGHWLY